MKSRIEKAKLLLLHSEPVVGFPLMHIPIVYDDKADMPIATNGKVIIANPLTLKGNLKEIAYLLSHNTSHILFNHIQRFKKLEKAEQKTWNDATDVVINTQVLGHVKDKPRGLIEQSNFRQLDDIKRQDLKSEEVYRLLREGQEEEQDNNGDGEGEQGSNQAQGGGDLVDKKTDQDKQIDDKMKQDGYTSQEDFWRNITDQGIAYAKSIGKGHTDLTRIFENAIEKKRDWRTILRRSIRIVVSNKGRQTTYNRPNRRIFSMPILRDSGIILPSFAENKMKLIFAVDTSGSVDDEDYRKQVAEVMSIVKSIRCQGYLMLFDNGIAKLEKMNKMDKKKINEFYRDRSYGGTDLCEVFEFAEKHKTDMLIILTDTHAIYPDKTRIKNTIFLTYEQKYSKQAEKFGKVIVLER